MRKEKDLNVDVHSRALRAAERTNNGTGGLQAIAHEPEVLNAQGWVSRLLPHKENLMVNGRQVSGFVVPHWAAGVILAAIISGMGFMYSRISDQRDMLIEMKTELRLAKEHDTEARLEFKNKLELQQVYINDLSKQVNGMKTMLTPQQARALDRTRRSEN